MPTYSATLEGKEIWSLVSHLNASSPDQDSERLGLLTRLSMQADSLHREACAQHKLRTRAYRQKQEKLYRQALQMVQEGDEK